MPKKYPGCPLANPLNCKDYDSPTVCAFRRKDKICHKKIKKTSNKIDPDAQPQGLDSMIGEAEKSKFGFEKGR